MKNPEIKFKEELEQWQLELEERSQKISKSRSKQKDSTIKTAIAQAGPKPRISSKVKRVLERDKKYQIYFRRSQNLVFSLWDEWEFSEKQHKRYTYFFDNYVDDSYLSMEELKEAVLRLGWESLFLKSLVKLRANSYDRYTDGHSDFYDLINRADMELCSIKFSRELTLTEEPNFKKNIAFFPSYKKVFEHASEICAHFEKIISKKLVKEFHLKGDHWSENGEEICVTLQDGRYITTSKFKNALSSLRSANTNS